MFTPLPGPPKRKNRSSWLLLILLLLLVPAIVLFLIFFSPSAEKANGTVDRAAAPTGNQPEPLPFRAGPIGARRSLSLLFSHLPDSTKSPAPSTRAADDEKPARFRVKADSRVSIF